MELQHQIKQGRMEKNLSQEELAEKIYVTRQSISNWETGKNYPDIHSLLLMSSLFEISLDQLIKGDIKLMEKEIAIQDTKKMNKDASIFTILFFIMIISIAPLTYYLKMYGFLIYGVIVVITFYYALKIEKFKKQNDIQSYREILAFMQGEKLDTLAKEREYGKRPYQKFLLVISACIIGFVISYVLIMIMMNFH